MAYIYIYIYISVVLVQLLVISALTWLVSEQGRSIRHLEDLNHRDRVDSRARYLETINHCHDEYRAMVESYVRQEGKVFVTPVSRFDDKPQRSPDPPIHAFRHKPPPPVTPAITFKKDTV